MIEDQGKRQMHIRKVLKTDPQQLTIKDEISENQLSDKVKNEIKENFL